MEALTRQEIRTAGAYEAQREAERRRIAEVKRFRRINLGHRLSLSFENHDTLRNAVEELVRTERIADESAIAAEVEAFNQLLPGDGGELSACLYVEVVDPAELMTIGDELSGVAETVSLKVGGTNIRARVHLVDAEDAAPLTFRLSFVLSAEQLASWRAGAAVAVVVAHPACSAETVLNDDQRAALLADLA